MGVQDESIGHELNNQFITNFIEKRIINFKKANDFIKDYRLL